MLDKRFCSILLSKKWLIGFELRRRDKSEQKKPTYSASEKLQEILAWFGKKFSFTFKSWMKTSSSCKCTEIEEVQKMNSFISRNVRKSLNLLAHELILTIGKFPIPVHDRHVFLFSWLVIWILLILVERISSWILWWILLSIKSSTNADYVIRRDDMLCVKIILPKVPKKDMCSPFSCIFLKS